MPTCVKYLFMHLVSSSTPALPLAPSVSVSAVKPLTSATITAAAVEAHWCAWELMLTMCVG